MATKTIAESEPGKFCGVCRIEPSTVISLGRVINVPLGVWCRCDYDMYVKLKSLLNVEGRRRSTANDHDGEEADQSLLSYLIVSYLPLMQSRSLPRLSSFHSPPTFSFQVRTMNPSSTGTSAKDKFFAPFDDDIYQAQVRFPIHIPVLSLNYYAR